MKLAKGQKTASDSCINQDELVFQYGLLYGFVFIFMWKSFKNVSFADYKQSFVEWQFLFKIVFEYISDIWHTCMLILYVIKLDICQI